ncbi:MAG: helix-turn-helix transcriptional regulator [Ruminococcus sp.]|nr:helix-turn-helix transcriptional regulator [Ruminococcus sp.]
MKTLSQKVTEARSALGMTRKELGEKTGVSERSIAAYEKGEKIPREKTIFRLAQALRVSTKYLREDDCTDPGAELEKDHYLSQTQERYGNHAMTDVRKMLEENIALFAGGELSQAEKDIYFDAVMTAYVTCKEKAKEKFGNK